MLLIFAGTHKQADHFIRENNLDKQKVRCVSRPEHLMGVDKAEYIPVGEYWLNEVWFSERFNTKTALKCLVKVDKNNLDQYKRGK